jgi:transposase-like protein
MNVSPARSCRRLEEDRLACLVIVGVLPDGSKEVVALEDGYREPTESWASVLRDLKRRGMTAPVLAIGDGNLGFWAAEIAHFSSEYQVRYPKAIETLTKDQDQLLTFFDFPAEHWIHLRTTNPIESTSPLRDQSPSG